MGRQGAPNRRRGRQQGGAHTQRYATGLQQKMKSIIVFVKKSLLELEAAAFRGMRELCLILPLQRPLWTPSFVIEWTSIMTFLDQRLSYDQLGIVK